MTALTHKDRVLEITNTTGTGPFLLGGAQSGYYTFFASFGAGVQCGYSAANLVTGENEVGKGTVVDNGDGTYSLSRDTIERSSNANAKVDFAAGRKTVCHVLLATEADTVTSVADNAILKDGTVTFTADQSMGSHKLTNVTDPASAQDAATKAYVDAQVATSGNVDVTNPTTVDCVPSWDDTAGTLRPSSSVKIHNSSSDKLEVAAQFGAIATAVDGATITLDLDTANDWIVPLGGNHTLAYTHASMDQLIWVLIRQDATGGWIPIWWSNIYWANAVAPVIDTTATTGWNAVQLRCIGLDGYGVPIWYEVSRRSSSLAGSIFETNGADELLQLDGAGLVATANLPASVTLQGNTFNGASELVQLDGSGKLPAIDGSQLTNVPGVGLHSSASLTFGSVGPAGSVTVTATLTGALTTDSVWCGPRGNLTGPFNFYAWVSASDTITIQITNAGTIAATPSVLTWDFRIWR